MLNAGVSQCTTGIDLSLNESLYELLVSSSGQRTQAIDLRFSPQPEISAFIPVATTAPVDPIASGTGEVWSLDKDGKPGSRKVTVGVTDGRRTQVTSNNVTEGEAFILDIAQPGRAARP